MILGFVALIVILLFAFAGAEDITGNVVAVNDTNMTIDSINNTSVGVENNSNVSLNQINVSFESPSVVVMKNFFPKDFKIGDVQFNIQVQNNGNLNLSDVSAFVSGKGFSTYDVTPIELLSVGQKDYVFVSGNFREAGNISLTIKISGEIFYQNVSVLDPSNANQKQLDDLKKQESQKAELANLSVKLDELKVNYSALEDSIADKKDDNYDVSKISLTDLKSYIRNVQVGVLDGNLDSAKVNYNLAIDEYADLIVRLSKVKKISTISVLKDNIVIFSTIAGAILTLFAFYELVKKKKREVSETISSKIHKKDEGKK